MRDRSAGRSVILLGLALAMLPRAAGANCGAEGCPLSPQGPETPAGRFSFDFGYQFVEQNKIWEGSHEISEAQTIAAEGGNGHIIEELTRTKSFLVNARARVTDRLLVTASWPYIDRIHRHALVHVFPGGYVHNEASSEWHIRGAGDATVMTHWKLLSGSQPTSGALTLQAGVKLPTGQRHIPELDGEEPEPPVRPGSGSTDLALGALYSHPIVVRTLDGLNATAPLSATVTARMNGRGTEEYRMGNEWLASLAAGYPIVHRVQLLAQVNASSHQRDDVGNTDAVPHSTGSMALYASPGMRLEILSGVSFFGYYQFRLYEHTNGPQLFAPYHLTLGMGYAFSR